MFAAEFEIAAVPPTDAMLALEMGSVRSRDRQTDDCVREYHHAFAVADITFPPEIAPFAGALLTRLYADDHQPVREFSDACTNLGRSPIARQYRPYADCDGEGCSTANGRAPSSPLPLLVMLLAAIAFASRARDFHHLRTGR